MQSIIEENVRVLIEKRDKTYSEKDRYKHAAILFDAEKSNAHYFYSIGTNYDLVHAEMDAINKIKPNIERNKRKNYKNINILIIRYRNSDETRELAMSKPCALCLYYMATKLLEKGYTVRNIYYSTDDNKIEKASLIEMICDNLTNTYMTGLYKRKTLINPLNKLLHK